jgi:hypothetical protein
VNAANGGCVTSEKPSCVKIEGEYVDIEVNTKRSWVKTVE